MEEIDKGKAYILRYTQKERRCVVSYKVSMVDGGEELDCECGQFAHMGLLCWVSAISTFIHEGNGACLS